MSELLQPTAHAWTRERVGAELTGVCAALANAMGIPVAAVRTFFALGGLALVCVLPATLLLDLTPLVLYALLGIGGSVMLVYVLAWWALPLDREHEREVLAELSSAPVRGKPALRQAALPLEGGHTPFGTAVRWAILAGIVGASVAIVSVGVFPALLPDIDIQAPLAIGAGILTAGIALGTLPLSSVDTARWTGRVSSLPLAVTGAVVVGGLLLVGGALVIVGALLGVRAMGITAAATLFSLALASILVVPWTRRLWAGMREESRERALADHQAEIASHLHDSVLQTLTVIQRESTPPERMKHLARQQEVELRRWLYGNITPGSAPPYATPRAAAAPPQSLREAVTRTAEEAERAHEVPIEVVCVGDAPFVDGYQPLLLALREATSNAARHGKVGVQVFLDATGENIEVFVRDRGEGFDMSAIPEGRLGVRESILGRMARAGGFASVRGAIGGGCEVSLVLERQDNQRHG